MKRQHSDTHQVAKPAKAPEKELILASGSKIRRKLLKNAGIAHRAVLPPLDEEQEKQRAGISSASQLALHLATAKALSFAANENQFVLGSDQVLEFENQALDKVENMQKAHDRLQALRAKTHFLVGASVLVHDGQVIWQNQHKCRMKMRKFSKQELDTYLDTCGKRILFSVGCYEIEREGISLFEEMQGDHFAILGMALLPLQKALREHGLL